MSDGPSSRDALVRGFREEAREHLEAVSRALVDLEKRPGDASLLEEMMRRLHNLKGAAKVVGADGIAHLAHLSESVLEAVGGGGKDLDPDATDALLQAADAMRAVAEGLGEGRAVDPPAALLERLGALAGPAQPDPGGVSAPIDPDIRAVLTEAQAADLSAAGEQGKTCWELEFCAPEAEFGARIQSVHREVKALGEVISVTGLSPRAGGVARLKFLVSTQLAPLRLEEFCRGASMSLTGPVSPPATPARPAPPTNEGEEVFATEMAALVEKYVAEKVEDVENLSHLMLALEERPDDRPLLNEIFRQAHSLKGSGAIYGFPAVSQLSGQMETVLDRLRNRTLKAGARVVDALLASVDALQRLFAEARQGRIGSEAAQPALRELAALLAAEAPPAAAAARAAEPPRPPVRETIRVRLEKLDRLVNLASELTIAKNTREAAVRGVEEEAYRVKDLLVRWHGVLDELRLSGPGGSPELREVLESRLDPLEARVRGLQTELEALWERFDATTQHATGTVESLQAELMSIRMVPVSLLFDTAPRTVRDLARQAGKEVSLSVSGADTEVDRQVLEAMADPLVHLLRNAVDHGLEPPSARARAGKSPAGRIALSAEHAGNRILITVSDDGRGMDPQLILRKAVERGFLTATQAQRQMPEEALSLIFQPGFSTRDDVTDVSGRGVGMDVVKSNVEKIKGHIEVESHPGRGTTFRIQLPLSVAIVQAVLVESAGLTLALLAQAILEVVRLPLAQVETEDERPCFQHRGRTVPLVSLAELLSVSGAHPRGDPLTVVVVQGIEGRLGLVVSRALEEVELVLKTMGSLLKRVPHVAGGTILADGRIAVILDASSLVSAAVRRPGAWTPEAEGQPAPPRRSVLVVDDSLTTRELLKGLLEGAGYAVATARHGREALEILEQRQVDVVVTDIAMPEMDGYALVQAIRGHPRLGRMPVILVTGALREEERLAGLKAQADAYMLKGSFDQAGLLERVADLAGRP